MRNNCWCLLTHGENRMAANAQEGSEEEVGKSGRGFTKWLSLKHSNKDRTNDTSKAGRKLEPKNLLPIGFSALLAALYILFMGVTLRALPLVAACLTISITTVIVNLLVFFWAPGGDVGASKNNGGESERKT